MEEVWKDIPNYNGEWQASNYGNIRKDGKLLKKTVTPQGYEIVGIGRKPYHKIMLVHRLVAMTFIENPNGYPQINHKDENKSNNNVDNLEWCTQKYNINYGTRTAKTYKPVVAVALNGEIEYYNSITEASKMMDRTKSAIVIALKRERPCCKRKWYYADQFIVPNE
jgi:hypothetical protein